jgi:hypothetical protein
MSMWQLTHWAVRPEKPLRSPYLIAATSVDLTGEKRQVWYYCVSWEVFSHS